MPPRTPENTTCQLVTPAGTGAIAVVRVRGPGAWRLVRRHVGAPAGESGEVPAPGHLFYSVFADQAGAVDDVIVSAHRVEDEATVDLSCHGGVRVVERILLALTGDGAALVDGLARASGPSRWREGIPWRASRLLERVTTRRAALFLAAQTHLLPKEFEHIIQVAEEGDVGGARAALLALAQRSDGAEHLVRTNEVALVGPANVGKSRLANRLAGSGEGPIVTDRAGTTRDWVSLEAAMEGVPVRLIDTAGDRPTADLLEQEAIRVGRRRAEATDLYALVLDAADLPADEMLRDWCARLRSGRWIIVLNKSDLCPCVSLNDVSLPEEAPAVLVSAQTGEGIDRLRRLIVSALGVATMADDVPVIFDADVRIRMLSLAHDEAVSAGDLAERIREALC